MKRLPALLLALLSGGLLFLAFPPAGKADAAWIALVPLLLALRGASPRRGALLGAITGFAFWTGNLSWLIALGSNGGPTWLIAVGLLALSAYCALYLAWYGALVAWSWRALPLGRNGWTRALAALLMEPLLWVGCEFARGWFFTGFPWNSLGVSQYRNLPLAQAAALGGLPLLSLLLAMTNGAIASLIQRMAEVFRATTRRQTGPKVRFRAAELLVAVIVLCAASLWGAKRIRAWRAAEPDLPAWTVAIVQPYTPSIFEIDAAALDASIAEALGHTACAGIARPHLVVWPESSLPGTLPYDPAADAVASNIAAAANAPALVGAVEYHPGPGPDPREGARCYNSSVLYGADGAARAIYRKQHLVPFGEYIPFETLFPSLKQLLPIGESCLPGEPCVPMEVDGLLFSPLICFEDIFPYLARRAVAGGARLLVNQTNDAWFDGSSEPCQHLAQSVFRAIENGVPLVRSANGGVSGLIDPVGRTTLLASDGRDSGFSGFLVTRAVPPPSTCPATPYTRFGDWTCGLPALCVTLLATLGLSWRKRTPPADP
ncbi:MAG: apolipoprotein N-acyltransferase [Kiritimatiellia bacterium]|jgi:apolipoprotein N-acyltransferase